MLQNKSILSINKPKFYIGKKLSLSCLVCALFLTACQPQSTPEEKAPISKGEDVASQTLTLQGSIKRLNLNLPDCSGNSCPKLNVDRLETNYPFVDQVIDQEIYKNLSQILEVSKLSNEKEVALTTDGVKSAVDSTEIASQSVVNSQLKLEQKIAPLVEDFLELDKALKSLNTNQEMSILVKPLILNSVGPMVTVVLNTSSYLGGAHGSTSQQYYNFHLVNQTQILLKDMLLPNQKKVLEEKAYDAFKAWILESKLAENVEEYEQAWKFKLSDNFLLGEQGLILQYHEYEEVGPYSAGLPRLIIPYSELDGVLKPEYLSAVKMK